MKALIQNTIAKLAKGRVPRANYDIDLEDAPCCLVQFLHKNEKFPPQSLSIFLQNQNKLKIVFVPKFDQIPSSMSIFY